MADPDPLRGALITRLQGLHALKSGALRMFDPMLAAVARTRKNPDLAEVEDLLGRMHGNFSRHHAATKEHAGLLVARLDELGARPARGRTGLAATASAARAHLGAIGGMDFGAAARDAFVFEHLEIALAHLIEELAVRITDANTAALAKAIRSDDEQMAAIIDGNWTNVLSLTLAAGGLPVQRAQ